MRISPFFRVNGKKSVLFVAFLVFMLPVAAQSQISYEVDVHYGFGYSDLAFNSVPGLALTIYPKKKFGISIGFDYSWRWGDLNGAKSGENAPALDSEGDEFIFQYTIDDLKEERSAQIFLFPIMLKYNGDNFYVSAGAKIGIVNSLEENVAYKGLKACGYYPATMSQLCAPEYQGFVEQRDSSFTNDIDSKTLIMLALEGGAKFKLSKNFYLLGGIFADYSLNKGFDRKISTVQRRETGDGANIVVNSTWKEWNPLSVGAIIKLAYHFDFVETTDEEKRKKAEDELAKKEDELKKAQAAHKEEQAEEKRLAEELARKQKELANKDSLIATKDSLLAAQKAEADQKLQALNSQTINVFKDVRGTILSMSDILFESGNASLKPELKENLAEVAAILKTLLTESTVTIEGHTDNVGSEEANLTLSQQRAEAVLEYLVGRDVERSRLNAVGYGLSKPIAGNTTAEGRAKNRRVELIIK